MPIVTCSLGLSFAICEVVKACAKKRVIAKTEKKVSDFFKTYHELDLENKAIHFATDSTPKEIMDLVKDGILSRKLKRI